MSSRNLPSKGNYNARLLAAVRAGYLAPVHDLLAKGAKPSYSYHLAWRNAMEIGYQDIADVLEPYVFSTQTDMDRALYGEMKSAFWHGGTVSRLLQAGAVPNREGLRHFLNECHEWTLNMQATSHGRLPVFEQVLRQVPLEQIKSEPLRVLLPYVLDSTLSSLINAELTARELDLDYARRIEREA